MTIYKLKSVFVATLALACAAGGQAGRDAASSPAASASTSSMPANVIYIPRRDVDANFEHHKGMDESIYDSDYGAKNFKVKTSHRDQPARAEVHMTYTDVVYVVKGSATLVTGGKLVDIITPATYPNGKPFSKDEIWGRSIAGGTSRVVTAGDVIIVPNGVPHWFSKINAPPFWFFNVKVK